MVKKILYIQSLISEVYKETSLFTSKNKDN